MITPPKPPPSVIGLPTPHLLAHVAPAAAPAPTPAPTSHNHVAEEDSIKAKTGMTVTDGSVSFTSAAGNESTVNVSGDIFQLDGTTANVVLNALAAANSTTRISFAASTGINLTAGGGNDIVTTLKGVNTFTSTTPGTLTVTGGVGADAYRLGYLSGGMTINDFSLAKGDTLTVDNNFIGHSIKTSTDGAGGTFVDLQNNAHHYVQVDLRGVDPTSLVGTGFIHYAAVGGP